MGRSHDRTLSKQARHLVNVWASGNGLVLDQADYLLAVRGNKGTCTKTHGHFSRGLVWKIRVREGW